jgi:hypothetical protein
MEPDIQKGIEYWNEQDASYNGVLGRELHPSFSTILKSG